MKTSHKIALLAIKYYAPIAALCMTIHVLLLLMGYNLLFAEMAVGMSVLPTIVLFCVDVAFGFCWLHKSMLFYTIFVNICIWFQRWIGFGEAVTTMRWLVLIIGIALWVLFVEHISTFNRRCYDSERTERGS